MRPCQLANPSPSFGAATYSANDLSAWVKVLVHPVAKAKQLFTLGLHTLKEAWGGTPDQVSTVSEGQQSTTLTALGHKTPARGILDEYGAAATNH